MPLSRQRRTGCCDAPIPASFREPARGRASLHVAGRESLSPTSSSRRRGVDMAAQDLCLDGGAYQAAFTADVYRAAARSWPATQLVPQATEVATPAFA